MNIRFLLLVVVFALTACSWGGKYDRRETYIKARSIPPTQIPASLDKPDFEDVMVIPAVDDPRHIAGKKMDVGLPESLGAGSNVDQIVIKKLGDSRWVFLDAPPATVWPKIRQYWEDQHIPLANVDPSKGIMETDWLVAKAGTPKEMLESITQQIPVTDAAASTKQKFRLRVEPGIRTGSTEIYLQEKSVPVGVPMRQDHIDWSGKSDNIDMEAEVLTNLAYYLGAHINRTYSVSQLAENIGGQKAELSPDRVKPVLTYRLRFDRAWATVGDALENASIKAYDKNRDAANYYVYFDPEHQGKPGFFSRLIHGKDAGNEGPEYRYIVHLEKKGDREVEVTVLKDLKNLPDPEVAEKLLKIIKANST